MTTFWKRMEKPFCFLFIIISIILSFPTDFVDNSQGVPKSTALTKAIWKGQQAPFKANVLQRTSKEMKPKQAPNNFSGWPVTVELQYCWGRLMNHSFQRPLWIGVNTTTFSLGWRCSQQTKRHLPVGWSPPAPGWPRRWIGGEMANPATQARNEEILWGIVSLHPIAGSWHIK